MGYNFNFPNIFSFDGYKSPIYQMPTLKTTETKTSYFNPLSANQSIAKLEAKASILDTANFISSLKTKYTDSFMRTFGYRVPAAKVKIEKDTPLDFTVMQNYGITCPKDTKETTIKDAQISANYGIVLSPEEDTPVLRETKFRSDVSMGFCNYGIICPSDVSYLNNYYKS